MTTTDQALQCLHDLHETQRTALGKARQAAAHIAALIERDEAGIAATLAAIAALSGEVVTLSAVSPVVELETLPVVAPTPIRPKRLMLHCEDCDTTYETTEAALMRTHVRSQHGRQASTAERTPAAA